MSRSAVSSALPESSSAPPRPLRRLTAELCAIIVLKIALLTLIWWVAFAPQPQSDVSPDAIAQRLAPTAHAPPEARP